MENTVYVRTYSPPEVNKAEILRYLGKGSITHELDELINECITEAGERLSYRVCYGVFSVKHQENEICFDGVKVESRDLLKNLDGSSCAVIFAATVGIEIDRLIKRYAVISPSKSVIFQAIGAERVEALCDEFCKDVADEFGMTKPRFSPGYGDFPLEFQREIFKLLEPEKLIGVSLGGNLLMVPSKSVTAVVGIVK
ncbi:MAG: Vitamin B12 dependent methionine synthase activation subunit [Ruminococcaceae bacterium]|nr:Vitamin B12 dependent methionine synthase activation subunit [Oscillospiraceae bacterium]